jgi:hypothetical protein
MESVNRDQTDDTVRAGVPAENGPAFPFIVGCGRSGTTLVRALFDTHPRMAVPGESHFIVHLAEEGHGKDRARRFDQARFLEALFRHPRFRLWELPEAKVRSRFATDRPQTFAEAIRATFAAYAAAQGKPRYGDKTPGYVMHIPFLASQFPEARFVHVIRDGRDVALSYREIEFGPDSLEGAALHWKRFVQRGRKTGKQLGADRYREVRYEDLLDDPEGVTRGLCAFLDLEFDPAMLTYPERAEEVARGSAFPHAHKRLRLPPTKGLRDWRTAMSEEDVVLFESLAGDLLARLGYERTVSPGTEDRLRAVSKRLRVDAGRAARRLTKPLRRAVGRRRLGTEQGQR